MIPLLLAFACLPVDGPKLLARHIAPAVAAFAGLAPDTELGFAPAPGVVRVVRVDEVRRIASKLGIAETLPASDVCFEWPMRPLDPELATGAMRVVLPPETRIEVLDVSRAPVPDGTLEFPLTGLQGNIWRGSVRYSDTGRFDVWARVRVTARQTRVVTLAPVRGGETLRPDQLRVEEFEDTPVVGLVPKVGDAAGLIVKRALPAGTTLHTKDLDEPHAVAKGDNVRLHAHVGTARVTAAASAQAQGRVGDIIPVKNASSGRVLRARIEAPGEVRLAQ